jgi:hypothetical protein
VAWKPPSVARKEQPSDGSEQRRGGSLLPWRGRSNRPTEASNSAAEGGNGRTEEAGFHRNWPVFGKFAGANSILMGKAAREI